MKSGPDDMDEFSIIEKYFAPLAEKYPDALGLKDDAALFKPAEGFDVVVTTDALVEDIHFFKDDNPEYLAQKLLGVNVSDLAAMGATPKAYLLTLMLPEGINDKWLPSFSEGLAKGCERFGGCLIGGDTTRSKYGLSLSLTAIGEVAQGKALKKSGAKPGDKIYVSGTIGDSYLGLQILSGKLDLDSAYLKQRYYKPEPRIALGESLVGLASSCTDISDGLIADLEHICKASTVGAVIRAGDIPLSDDAKNSGVNIQKLITGGDDYELLYTVADNIEPPEGAYYIGDIVDGEAVSVLDEEQKTIVLESRGYSHF